MTRWSALALMMAFAIPAAAQEPAPRPAPTVSLSLNEAQEQARRNSPAYRQSLNDAGPAGWGVRSAYATFLPSLDVSTSFRYVGEGQSAFGGTLFSQGATLSSSYGVQLGWRLNGETLAAPAQQRASQRATDADITNAGILLQNDVTTQYLATLQAIAQTDVARQQVIRNEDFRALAEARYRVGQTTLLDLRQAEVTKGQSEVSLLRAQQTEAEAKLELFRRMGIMPPVEVSQVGLSDSFPVTEPTYRLEDLVPLAEAENPALRALRAREDVASAQVRANRSQYFPTISFNASWSGFTQEFRDADGIVANTLGRRMGVAENCRFQNGILQRLTSPHPAPNGGIIADCNAFAGLDATGSALPAAARDSVINRNNVFPFNYTSQPFRASVTVSLPIFNNFGRELQLSQAQAAREDAVEAVRGRELAVRAEVQARWLGVQTAYRAIAVQRANQDAAREQLRLAQDRYRRGSGSAPEVSDAQAAVTRAEGDYVNAIYDYHRAIAALEFAVGRPLR